MYLFGWIKQGTYGPLGLLSGPLYRRKLLSLVFMWTLRCNSFNAKRFIHVSFWLNNAIWVWPFGATVWGQVQEKKLLSLLFSIQVFTHEWYATIFIHVLLQLSKWLFWPPISWPPGSLYRTWPGSNANSLLLALTKDNQIVKPFVSF